MRIPFSLCCNMPGIKTCRIIKDIPINYLVTDSRKIQNQVGSLFIAIKGENHNAHQYLDSCYEKGIRHFVLSEDVDLPRDASYVLVEDSIRYLQSLAAYLRNKYTGKVIAITGSNGKTMVKEWLSAMLSHDFKVHKSPKSYNSQIGVPLSVWSLNNSADYGIFEAGISEKGEMASLAKILKPNIGIFTNLGSAHDAGFTNRIEKGTEKALLFDCCDTLIYCADHPEVNKVLEQSSIQNKINWSLEGKGKVNYQLSEQLLTTPDGNQLHLPFKNYASIENLIHIITFLKFIRIDMESIQAGLDELQPISMRLELKKGNHQNYIIDDSYNNDPAGLEMALQFLQQQKLTKKTAVILGDIEKTHGDPNIEYKRVADLLTSYKVDQVYTVGHTITKFSFNSKTSYHTSLEKLIDALHESPPEKTTILIKGPRSLKLEKVSKMLTEKAHATTLEINLDHLAHNLNFFRRKLPPKTKLMVMVKAFAYGSGNEIVRLLEYQQIDYLAVAYVDEGIRLRDAGVKIPILVLNPLFDNFDRLLDYNLEPEIYSFDILDKLISNLDGNPIAIHLKIDTGMNRLGFSKKDIESLVSKLLQNPWIMIKSVFSHLAASDDPEQDNFTKTQIRLFNLVYQKIASALDIQPLAHLVNSSGIHRFPQATFDMVRLGIGLYGFDPTEAIEKELKPVGTLKTVISQVKWVKKGESVGYGRQNILEQDLKIATVSIGYADGFFRNLSNGVGGVYVNKVYCPVVGKVCMDMVMVDVSSVPCAAGDEVIVFGSQDHVRKIASSLHTIPYEIISAINERVKRTYFLEG